MTNVTVWDEAIGAWLGWLAAGSARRATLELRGSQMRRFAREADPAGRGPYALSEDELAAWLGSRGWQRETIRSHRSALRSFYGWAHAAGRVGVDPSRLLRKVTPSRPRPRPAPEPAVDAAIELADDRVRLMLMLGSRHGLRRGEIARVAAGDVVEDLTGYSLIVHGKGGKDRVVPLLDETAAAILARPGWTFGNRRGGHLSAPHVGKLMSATLGAGVTAHQLRHRFATRAHERTRNMPAVQELLGHASLSTTRLYVAVDDRTLREVLRAAS